MYLLSLYFDKKTKNTIQKYINKVAINSGNKYMIDKKVPPHITILAFDAKNEDKIFNVLNETLKNIKSGKLQWVSIGIFKSKVIYITPILNEYLHTLSVDLYNTMNKIEDVIPNKYYLPLNWLPHTTIGKNLSCEEMFSAFKVMHKDFSIFTGNVIKIGLSKTNPHKEIAIWDLL